MREAMRVVSPHQAGCQNAHTAGKSHRLTTVHEGL